MVPPKWHEEAEKRVGKDDEIIENEAQDEQNDEDEVQSEQED